MKAHFIGICGAGMSAVAKLLKESGWEISGSDEGFYPPISTYLEHNNLPCTPHYSVDNIPKDAAIIVIGKHAKLVPEENDEVRAAFASGIPIKSFPEVLNQLTQNTKNFVVAGSFGKSTCASLAAWTLVHAGKDPSYFVGALARNLPTNAHLGKGKSFVLEGDEYPSANWDNNAKFLYYNAATLLLTSAEHDHVNVFPTVESYVAPYVQLVLQLPSDGLFVACLDGAHVTEIIEQTGRRAITYSLHQESGAEWYAANITRETTTTFDLYFRSEKITTLFSHLLGDHNVQNMVGVAAWLLSNDAVTVPELQAGFATFKGVKRRLELKTIDTTIPVYEDFGSSHAKATAGLTTVRQQFPHKRLIVLFEPHTFSFRNRAALSWYSSLFNPADSVFIYQPPTHGATTHEQLTQDEIVDAVRATGKTVYPFTSKDQLIELLRPMLRSTDVILIETSGEMGGSIEAVTQYVQEHYQIPTTAS